MVTTEAQQSCAVEVKKKKKKQELWSPSVKTQKNFAAAADDDDGNRWRQCDAIAMNKQSNCPLLSFARPRTLFLCTSWLLAAKIYTTMKINVKKSAL